jgi:hypothetical protein
VWNFPLKIPQDTNSKVNMLAHSTQGLDNSQPSFQLGRDTIPYIDRGSPCEQRQEIFSAIMAGLNLKRYNKLWAAMGVRSHLQIPYLYMSPNWSCALMYDVITNTVSTFPEVPFRMEGPAVIWDAISVFEIIAVLHTFKGYVQDMLEQELNELTYVQTTWILRSFWEHYESKGLVFTSLLTQQLLDPHVVTSRIRTRADREARLRSESRHQS